jgi:outer membrane lipoprotein-sorting protein
VPKAPSITQTVAPEELVARLNQRWAALESLTATVEIQASEIKSKEGIAKGSPTFRGHILMRKPGMLRVLGFYLGVKAFDTASDGKNFTLYMPTKNKAVKGSNALKKKSVNPFENLRPGFFFDALAVQGLEPDDFYSVTADTETLEDAARKHLYLVPEYILSITRRKPGSQKETPVRVVTFHRDDLQPYQQDIYDSDGNLETQVFYSAYQDFGSSKYPSKVTIKRPLEELEIVLSVEDVKKNQTLTDDQFVVKLPEGTEIQQLE